jgi:hypothetical protein
MPCIEAYVSGGVVVVVVASVTVVDTSAVVVVESEVSGAKVVSAD